jgi:hypothetical protein
MGTSTNGQICFGILFEEDFEFPWTSDEDGEGDIHDWWIYQIHGFKHDIELFDEAGNHIDGKEPSKEDLEKYYGPKRAFEVAHPLPIELVNYCSGDSAMYILAVPSSTMTARRGYPEEFQPERLTVTQQEIVVLLDFCRQHYIEMPSEPKWYLSSLWM